MNFFEYRKKLVKLNFTTNKVGELVTEPNQTRTIREILKDTIEGRPSPSALEPLPNDFEAPDDTDKRHIAELDEQAHKKVVYEDKFDAINRSRQITAEARQKVKQSVEREQVAKEQAKKRAIDELVRKERERERANEQREKEQ